MDAASSCPAATGGVAASSPPSPSQAGPKTANRIGKAVAEIAVKLAPEPCGDHNANRTNVPRKPRSPHRTS
jgi:hypothetical protein